MWTDNDDMLQGYNCAISREESSPLRCPVCGEIDGHVAFYKFNQTQRRGSIWIWCNKCTNYAHGECIIPEWWKNPPYINQDLLSATIEYLRQYEEEMDHWINELKKS